MKGECPKMAQNDRLIVIVWLQRKTHGFEGLNVKEVPVLEKGSKIPSIYGESTVVAAVDVPKVIKIQLPAINTPLLKGFMLHFPSAEPRYRRETSSTFIHGRLQ